jgi:hypothetical protein
VTVHITCQLECDGCGAIYDASPDVIGSPQAVRDAARLQGWRIGRRGRKPSDKCPQCSPGSQGGVS